MANIGKIPDLNKDNPLHRKAEHASKPEAPASPAAKLAVQSSDPRIDIRVYKRKDETYYAAVMMFSKVRPNHAVEAPLELTGKSDREIGFEIGVLCGAMAERLNELNSENLDPEKCGRFGEKTFIDVMRKWESDIKQRG